MQVSVSFNKCDNLLKSLLLQFVNPFAEPLGADMEKVKSLPPADSHFQIFAKVKFQIEACFLEISTSTARLLHSFSRSKSSHRMLQIKNYISNLSSSNSRMRFLGAMVEFQKHWIRVLLLMLGSQSNRMLVVKLCEIVTTGWQYRVSR